MGSLYAMHAVTKDQIVKCIEYMRRTLFGHLQLYLACLAQKQQRVNKKIIMFPEVPMMESGNLETDC